MAQVRQDCLRSSVAPTAFAVREMDPATWVRETEWLMNPFRDKNFDEAEDKFFQEDEDEDMSTVDMVQRLAGSSLHPVQDKLVFESQCHVFQNRKDVTMHDITTCYVPLSLSTLVSIFYFRYHHISRAILAYNPVM